MRSKLLVLLLVGLLTTLSACNLLSVKIKTYSGDYPSAPPAELLLLEKVKAEDVITEVLAQLPEGQVYHNVPEQMQVGVSGTIEAGIAPEVTEKIKKELQGKGIFYDASGVEMKLVVKKDEFDVFELRSGKQFVTAKTPGKWLWQMTPLKSGDNLIIVKAIVELTIASLNVTCPVEVEFFSARWKVDGNFGYSVSHFVSTKWKEALSLVVGFVFVTWWIARKDKKRNES